MRKRGISEFVNASRVLHALVFLGFGLAFIISIFSCQDIYIGKTEEELVQEMFRVDSLINHISFMIDSIQTIENIKK